MYSPRRNGLVVLEAHTTEHPVARMPSRMVSAIQSNDTHVLKPLSEDATVDAHLFLNSRLVNLARAAVSVLGDDVE
tara:strand:+ start:3093 stop:3320 length:228 start_codon:yes stop_codon:yes gene_type:complete